MTQPDRAGVLPSAALQIVGTMPLHAITALYGEAGLRARLAMEAGRLTGAGQSSNVADALELATRLHQADMRQSEPYVNHVIRVALRIICHYGVLDAEVACAALLHDSVEDHADDLSPDGRDGALGILAKRFGPRVASLVEAVTNPVWDPGADKHEQYRLHVTASLEANPWARVLKASDFTDNGTGLIYTTGPRAARLARKYAPLVPVLAGLITRADTPLSAAAKDRIIRQLGAAQRRFAAITG
jgi:hypothetical protein